MGGKSSAEHYRAYYAANRERRLANAKRSYEKHHDQSLAIRQAWNDRNGYDSRIRRKGISTEEYERRFAEQGGLCAICRKGHRADRRFDIDHDHATGAIRGLLCQGCNMRLGRFRDDTAALRAAGREADAVYLERAVDTLVRS